MSRWIGIVLGLGTAGLLPGCSEAEPGRAAAPAGAATPATPVQQPGPPTPAEDLIVVSGPGLSRPMPLDQVTRIFRKVHLDRTYPPPFEPTYDYTAFGVAVTMPVYREITNAGLLASTMPSQPAECGGCKPSGHLDIYFSKPTAETYRLVVELRTPYGARTWTLERSETDLNIAPVTRIEAPFVGQVYVSIGEDFKAIGRELCRTLTARSCEKG